MSADAMTTGTPLRPPDNISHFDALRLMYARTESDPTELARAVRSVLTFHTIHPGLGKPDPGCSFCNGAGAHTVDMLGAQHCHCACDWCVCGDALCEGPCGTLEALVAAAVLGGTPPGAIDVDRLLLQLHAEAVRRIAAAEIAATVGRGQLGPVTQQRGKPGAVLVTVNSSDAAAAAEIGLRRAGYQCELLDKTPPGQNVGVEIRLRVTPPAEPGLS